MNAAIPKPPILVTEDDPNLSIVILKVRNEATVNHHIGRSVDLDKLSAKNRIADVNRRQSDFGLDNTVRFNVLSFTTPRFQVDFLQCFHYLVFWLVFHIHDAKVKKPKLAQELAQRWAVFECLHRVRNGVQLCRNFFVRRRLLSSNPIVVHFCSFAFRLRRNPISCISIFFHHLIVNSCSVAF